MRWKAPLYCVSMVIVSLGCAVQSTPSGGPKDPDPPRFLEEESTASQQTNFDEDEIKLTFDEWITLNNAFTQVVISPPLDYFPDIRQRGKSVVIKFDEEEVLKENTTYTINFGEAIEDLNERNTLENFSFVFSTGPVIDSLVLEGQVTDVSDGKPAGDVLVLLHDNPGDSSLYKNRPDYFAKTDASGRYRIRNIRADTFQLYALKDQNLNYLFDQPGESVGFLDSLSILERPLNVANLILFQEEQRPKPIQILHEIRGIAKVAYSGVLPEVKVTYDTTNRFVHHEVIKDTLYVWYMQQDTLPWNVFVQFEEDQDTIRILPRVADKAPGVLQFRRLARKGSAKLHPSAEVGMLFSRPLMTWDTAQFMLRIGDTTRYTDYNVKLDSLNPKIANLVSVWPENARFHLKINPGGFRDIYGETHDTLDIRFTIDATKNLSTLVLNIQGLDSVNAYVIQLLEGNTLVNTMQTERSATFSTTIKDLAPVKYVLQIIEDSNGNGKWDSGHILKRRQPERLQIENIDNLRPGWDVDFSVNWEK